MDPTPQDVHLEEVIRKILQGRHGRDPDWQQRSRAEQAEQYSYPSVFPRIDGGGHAA
jgi:hypothetical protein